MHVQYNALVSMQLEAKITCWGSSSRDETLVSLDTKCQLSILLCHILQPPESPEVWMMKKKTFTSFCQSTRLI